MQASQVSHSGTYDGLWKTKQTPVRRYLRNEKTVRSAYSGARSRAFGGREDACYFKESVLELYALVAKYWQTRLMVSR